MTITSIEELIAILMLKTPEQWTRFYTENTAKVEHMVGTGMLTWTEIYSTVLEDGSEVILKEKGKHICDYMPGAGYFPHPYSDPELKYNLLVIEPDKKERKYFNEGKVAQSFIKTSIDILRAYNREPLEEVAVPKDRSQLN